MDGFEIRGGLDGVWLDSCEDVLVRNNYSHTHEWDNRASGLVCWKSKNITFENNITNNTEDLGIFVISSENVLIQNNTLYNPNNLDGILFGDVDGIKSSNLTFKNNIVAATGTNGVRTADNAIGNTLIQYNLFWQIGSGKSCSACTLDNTNIDINSNPLFTNASSGDFSIQAGSPAIDKGDPSILDPDGTRSDIGAIYFPQ